MSVSEIKDDLFLLHIVSPIGNPCTGSSEMVRYLEDVAVPPVLEFLEVLVEVADITLMNGCVATPTRTLISQQQFMESWLQIVDVILLEFCDGMWLTVVV